MANKLVTVTWSITIGLDVPDDVSNETLIEADFNSPENVQTLACKACQDASAEINWKDGQITDVQDAE